MKYTILFGTPLILEEEVDEYLKKGFTLLGGLVSYNQTIAQAMIKELPDEMVKNSQAEDIFNLKACHECLLIPTGWELAEYKFCPFCGMAFKN